MSPLQFPRKLLFLLLALNVVLLFFLILETESLRRLTCGRDGEEEKNRKNQSDIISAGAISFAFMMCLCGALHWKRAQKK